MMWEHAKQICAEVVKAAESSLGFASIRIMRNPKRLGKGKSIEHAFHVAQGAVVGFIGEGLKSENH